MKIYPAVTPHRRCLTVDVNPLWDWSRVFRAASSGLLGEHESALRDSAREALRVDCAVYQSSRLNGHLAAYQCELTLISFGEHSIRHSGAMKWGIDNGFRPASLRETMALPSSHPNWYQMFPGWDNAESIAFTRIDPSQVYDFYLTDRGAFWANSTLAIVCLEAHASDGHKNIFGIELVDHGDFNLINYWASVSAADERDPCYLNQYDCVPYAPEGRIWFAFVSNATDASINELNEERSPRMKYVKTVVCFANSRKTGGFCVAGKEWHDGNPGAWIRPVSARPTHEIYQNEMRCDDGTTPHVLDVLAVPCERHQPISHQQENHVIDSVVSWEKEGRIAWRDIQKWTDTPPSLWGLGNGSYVGLNNRLSIGQEDGTSLYLVETDRLCLLVGRKAPEYADSKRAVRGEFAYRGVNYRMDVTDPEIEREYLGKPDGQYQIMRPVLCISLGDPYQGHFYKLIAAVLYKERFS